MSLVVLLDDVWERYKELAEESSTTISQSYHSRRTTFKEKVQVQLGNTFTFFQPLHRCPSERKTLLIPNKYQSEAVVRLVDSEEVMKPYYRYRDTLRMMTSSCRWYTLPLRLEAIC